MTSKAARRYPAGELCLAKVDSHQTAARQAKDFKRSDEIRDELAAAGIVLEDKPGGVTVWRRQ